MLDNVLNHHPVAGLQCRVAEVRDHWELCVCVSVCGWGGGGVCGVGGICGVGVYMRE